MIFKSVWCVGPRFGVPGVLEGSHTPAPATTMVHNVAGLCVFFRSCLFSFQCDLQVTSSSSWCGVLCSAVLRGVGLNLTPPPGYPKAPVRPNLGHFHCVVDSTGPFGSANPGTWRTPLAPVEESSWDPVLCCGCGSFPSRISGVQQVATPRCWCLGFTHLTPNRIR